MARASMAGLIDRLRNMVHDPAGSTETFSDDEIQSFLDEHQTEVRYAPLTPIETVQSGGTVVYLAYRSRWGWWEDGVSLVDENYDALSPATENLQTGRWTFAADTDTPVYIVGYYYDIYSAAVDLLTVWAAQYRETFDFTADGLTVRRNQQLANINGLIARYSALVSPKAMTMTRGDVLG